MIEVQIVGREQVVARLTGATTDIREALRNAVQVSVIDMEAQVKEKLSGPVLKTRTGRLRNSVVSAVDAGNTTITGTVSAKTPYAAAQEYGFQGVVTVREHLRLITSAFGLPLKGGAREVTVKAHPMKMDLPERSYLRSTLAENAQAIADRLQYAVRQVALGEAFAE